MGRPILIALGQKFGRLTVIRRAGSGPAGVYWECRCDCGKITQPTAYHLRKGVSQSCGCRQKEIVSKHNAKDITDKRFGRLIALYRTGERGKDGSVVWRVRCDCGCEFEATTRYLGLIKSCGCLQRETAAQLLYSHGSSREPIYKIWTDMKSRCFNPNHAAFKNYGGRGITVAAEWVNDFPAFRDYVFQNLGPRPKGYTLDRIENSENYEVGNLRWAPRTVQNHNTRRSHIEKAANAILREYANKPTKRRRRVI